MSITKKIKLIRYCIKHHINFHLYPEIFIEDHPVRQFSELLEFHSNGKVNNFNDRSRLYELREEIYRSIQLNNENTNIDDQIVICPQIGMNKALKKIVFTLCALYEFEVATRGKYVTGTDRYTFPAMTLSNFILCILLGLGAGSFIKAFL